MPLKLRPPPAPYRLQNQDEGSAYHALTVLFNQRAMQIGLHNLQDLRNFLLLAGGAMEGYDPGFYYFDIRKSFIARRGEDRDEMRHLREEAIQLFEQILDDGGFHQEWEEAAHLNQQG